jgi:hypothetical protein
VVLIELDARMLQEDAEPGEPDLCRKTPITGTCVLRTNMPKTMSPRWARSRRRCVHAGVSAIVSVAGGLEASHAGGHAKCELKRYQPARITRPEFRQDLETHEASPGPSEFLRFIIEEGETF